MRERPTNSGGFGMGRRGGGLGIGPRGWTVTTWIIAICVGVFVLDMGLAISGASLDVPMGVLKGPGFDQATPGDRVVVDSFERPSSHPRQWLMHPIVDGGSGVPISATRPNGAISRLLPDGREAVPIGSNATPDRVYPIIGEKRFLRYPPLAGIGFFSTGKGFVELEVWRLITFQFLHADLTHLVFNCIGLFFFGPIIEAFLRSKRVFLAFYLACGMAGAALYLVLNFIGHFAGIGPPFLVQDIYTPLIGASAGVFGILAASAVVAPRERIYLFFVIPMSMRMAALLLLAGEFYYLLVGSANAGGHAAHIGGAIAGFVLIKNPGLVAGFFDDFLPRGGRARQRAPKRRRRSSRDERRLDELLAKVSEGGRQNLTDEEVEFLDRMSRTES